jgi:diaminohydroxyphosphoribosylaminopyrimidine deaminase/5-amino-6-(5-phosphoribosylamino)uracil reductase
MASADDHIYMAEALREAEQGRFTASPNPNVGCVLVRDGQVIGRGAHLKTGEGHAEVNALADASGDASGSTAYVTLEPCAFVGRTPACANTLVKAGVSRVVIAIFDPHPEVSGKGVEILEAAGIEVLSGVMAAEAEACHAGFLSRMRRSRPFIRVKIAASLDGATALANGQSQWITGPEARADVQYWRARACAIVTGIETVLADDPQMNLRDQYADVPPPRRIVLDSDLRMPSTAKMLSLAGETTVVTLANSSHPRWAELVDAGAMLVEGRPSNGRIDLSWLAAWLAEEQINELHVEAGATLSAAFLQQGLVDEFLLYQAPVLLGSSARGMLDMCLDSLDQKTTLSALDSVRLGNDTRLRFKLAES